MPMQKPGGVNFIGPPLRVPPVGQQQPAQHPIYGPVNPMIQRFASGGVARSGVSLPVGAGFNSPTLFPTPIPGNLSPTPTPSPVPIGTLANPPTSLGGEPANYGSGNRWTFTDPETGDITTGLGDPVASGNPNPTFDPNAPPGFDPTMPVPPDVPTVDPITGRAIPVPTANPGGVRVGGIDAAAQATANRNFWLGTNPSSTSNPYGGTAGTQNGAFTTGSNVGGGPLQNFYATNPGAHATDQAIAFALGNSPGIGVADSGYRPGSYLTPESGAEVDRRVSGGGLHNSAANFFAPLIGYGNAGSAKDLAGGGHQSGGAVKTHILGQGFARGGVVPGRHPQFGDTVPAMLTPGEIVLNANEQRAMRIAPGKRPLLPPSITNQLYKNRMANPVQHFAQGGTVQLNPANRGMLHRNLGVPMGNKIPLALLMKAKHSPSMAVRKRANFAVNFAH